MRLSRLDSALAESLEIHGAEEPIREEELDELETLAIDWVNGKVVFDIDLPKEQLSMTFMGLLFMEKEVIPYDARLYEYRNKANNMGVNGYPCFFSFRVIRRNRFLFVLKSAMNYQAALKEARERIKEGR